MSSEIVIALIVAGLLAAATLVSAIVSWAAGKTGRLAENALGTENVDRIRRAAGFIVGPAPAEDETNDWPETAPKDPWGERMRFFELGGIDLPSDDPGMIFEDENQKLEQKSIWD